MVILLYIVADTTRQRRYAELTGQENNISCQFMYRENKKVKWYLRPLSVILLLFVVLGPLGLPLLYISPRFSKTLKIVLTIVVMIFAT